MTSDSEIFATPAAKGADCSALVTISTPDSKTPICRLGAADGIVGEFTVRQLVERVISPSSLLSLQVPLTQLEAESPTALSIGELLAADSCEVILKNDGAEGQRVVALDEPAAALAATQTGAGGNSFLNITLEVRSVADAVAPSESERRRVALPYVFEADPAGIFADALPAPTSGERGSEEPEAFVSASGDSPPAAEPVPVEPPASVFGVSLPAAEPLPVKAPSAPVLVADDDDAMPEGSPAEEPGSVTQDAPDRGIVAIVAKPAPKDATPAPSQGRKEYIRKSDWLRAQFLPEIQALDFSGLFVGNLGMGIREEQGRKTVVLADPARITDILLRGNSYRRANDHAKALICYQELVDMDPGNADFRFLMGQTLVALGQQEDAADAFTRAKELGHDGARKELESMKPTTRRARSPLGFLHFWRQ